MTLRTQLQNFLTVLYDLQKVNTEFPLQYIICLGEIAENEGICMSDLAEKTGMPLSTVSRITSALSQKSKPSSYNLITVKISPEEKRRKQIFLSPEGHEMISRINQNMSPQTTHSHACNGE